MTVPILTAEQRWECLACDLTDVTHYPANQISSRMHNCRGLKGLSVPMVPAGTKGKVETHEREDWIGKEVVRLDGDDRPIMNLVTTRDDGTDCTVYAPCIEVSARSHG